MFGFKVVAGFGEHGLRLGLGASVGGLHLDLDHAPDKAGNVESPPAQPGPMIAFPPELTGLAVASDKRTVSWNSEIPLAGSDMAHDALRGKLRQFPVGSGTDERTWLGASSQPRGQTARCQGRAPVSGTSFAAGTVAGLDLTDPGGWGRARVDEVPLRTVWSLRLLGRVD